MASVFLIFCSFRIRAFKKRLKEVDFIIFRFLTTKYGAIRCKKTSFFNCCFDQAQLPLGHCSCLMDICGDSFPVQGVGTQRDASQHGVPQQLPFFAFPCVSNRPAHEPSPVGWRRQFGYQTQEDCHLLPVDFGGKSPTLPH